jgi:dihydrofolate reductase
MDPTIEFKALFDQFDTLLMGRKTFEERMRLETGDFEAGKNIIVVSRTLQHDMYPGTKYTNLTNDVVSQVRAMKAEPGKDI